ncbi:L-carnitine dehydratase/bile acid-inducible protein F [Thermosulfidibacter takaii ABI70S6]|uniref:L-carnitine dehydratase/bile acid-inducible protein F n=1 Tax=Thermosulfidibacter takaii (strain DSM 17441 / JCM 13301 / NBRC 103674 / ABI70S6) TaxID=1298851 RepID=A0A0S3QUY1_THET7|nr:CaiB/BaiF CoA-transferase family protein [Thermosulfidibacter takaii]BAT72129.1 L-carnitine dehydratase/bile acid-inducible protein F [Thermosulfidibacter takaii ABI70S6]
MKKLPLEGLRVLDLSRLVPGPYASMILADFGAEVIKIEAPGIGDYARSFEPVMKRESSIFYALNRNKKSIVLNLKDEADREKFLELAKDADVILESFRPGVMDRLGVGYEAVSKVNPKIIWCSISGFGQQTPYKHMPGHDLNFVALGGVLDLTGYDRPAMLGTQLADLGSALWAVIGILLALKNRENTGKGDFVDVAMMDSVISWLHVPLAEFVGYGKPPERGRTWPTGRYPSYCIYRAKDGFVAVAGLEEKFWEDICKTIGREDLIPYHQSDEVWVKEELEKEFSKRSVEEWEKLAIEKGLCLSPVKNVAQVLEDPQVKERELIWELDVPDEERKPLSIAPPVKFLNIKPTVRLLPPKMGEHNNEILRGKKR